MAGRYLVTGAQLGMLIALVQSGAEEQVLGTIRDIYRNQFLGNSREHLMSDVEEISRLFYPTRAKVENITS